MSNNLIPHLRSSGLSAACECALSFGEDRVTFTSTPFWGWKMDRLTDGQMVLEPSFAIGF